TKGKGIGNEKLYFGYKEIHELFTRNVVQEFHLTDASPTPLYAKRYVVSGKVQKVAYRNWIRKEANKRSLSGYTRNLKNGKVVVVVGSGNRDTVNNFKSLCQKGPVRAKVEKVEEYLWESQIKIGFQIRKSNSS